jgi:RNA polymerase sigma-70 factor (ECF subfamily)
MDTRDEELVRRAQGGDRGAVDTLLRRHYDTIRAVVHRIVINSHDAEDATQMALIAIARGINAFDGRSSLTTWMYRIATNAAIDEVRRIRRRPLPTDDDIALNKSTTDSAEATITQMTVVHALRELPDEFRTALVLRHVADLEYEDIAAIQNVPVGTVRSRLSRAREQMARILADTNPSGQSGNESHLGNRQTHHSEDPQ